MGVTIPCESIDSLTQIVCNVVSYHNQIRETTQ